VPDELGEIIKERVGSQILNMKDPQLTKPDYNQIKFHQVFLLFYLPECSELPFPPCPPLQAWHMDQPLQDCWTVIVFLSEGKSTQFLQSKSLEYHTTFERSKGLNLLFYF
jgi:hypothetical protein